MQLRGKYAIAAAGLGLSACSQLMVPDVTAAGRFRNVKVARECSSSRAAPALDVGATVILGVIPAIVGVAAILGATPPFPDADRQSYEGVGIGLLIGGLAFGGGFGASASYGFGATTRCADERAKPLPRASGPSRALAPG
ncbi:MAG: hypothetical protein IPH44_21670 [Myxococcales bacterium]|jgi:hypothetical protein|nr:hypothetical protein [Myxococcales bacterium]MBK7191968.1 hypothetical protein [Myxococcales bacterium]MBP6842195.1 hypothetical protein [Kofleriaceae bacterium]